MTTRPFRATLLILGFAILAALPLGAVAYRVQPLIVELAPSGPASATKLILTNTEATPITLELTALTVAVGDDGEAVRTPNEEDLLIFPPQTIVPPGREQVVQIRYVGAPDIDSARIYGVRVSQLPVNVSAADASAATGTDLKVGVDFISHIIVQTDDMAPKLAPGAITRTEQGGLRVALANDGDGVALGAEMGWTLTDGKGETVTLTSEEVELEGFGAVLNDGVERAVIVSPDAAAKLSGDVQARVTYP